MFNLNKLGKAVNAKRTSEGKNVRDTAEKMGLNKSTLSEIENGALSNMSVSTLQILLKYLKAMPQDFYIGSKPKAKTKK